VWNLRGASYTPVISGLVFQEAARGDADAATQRLLACEQTDILEITKDALHLALATLAGVDYIVTWNFAHMVGPSAKAQLSRHLEKLGYKPPLIATPVDLLEE
jgi:hypothetical protein